MNPFVNGFQASLFFGDSQFLSLLVTKLPIELLRQDIGKRFGPGPEMYLFTHWDDLSDDSGIWPARGRNKLIPQVPTMQS